MNAMTAYCGLPCDTCPIHLATFEPDPGRRRGMRAEIAQAIAREYGTPLRSADEIDECDGCRAGARLFFGCRECPIRPCATARGLESCAICPDYACAPLQRHFEHDPLSRTRLDELRATRPATTN